MPTLVKDISGVGQVACGNSHTIAVSQDGRIVWSFGGGNNGMLKHNLYRITHACIHPVLLFSRYIKMTFNWAEHCIIYVV